MRALLQKELKDLVRTHRIVFLPAVFVVFGIMGPALIRLLPTIIKQAGQQVEISMPNFGPADGLNQYLQFSRQLGLLVIVVIFMGVVASERKEGLLSVLFVKPVSRLRYLSLRWAVNALYVLVSFAIGGGVAILYTTLLLGKPHIGAMGVALLLYLCYLLLVFSWTFFFSALFRQGPIAGGVSLVPLFVLPFLGALWKPLGGWGPYGAASMGSSLIGGADIAPVGLSFAGVASALIDLGLSLVLLLGAYAAIRRAEL
ncbi:MAG TPA: ABC transporter permease subunit [Thermoleophilia bacterium]